MPRTKQIKVPEFNKLKTENKLVLLPKFSSQFSNVYEYGDDLIIENITLITNQYWIVYGKKQYIKNVEKVKYYMSEQFLRRFDVYLEDSATLEYHKKQLLDELWATLKIDKTYLNYETITYNELPIIDKQVRKYGLGKSYEHLELHLALFASECANRYYPGGHWKIVENSHYEYGTIKSLVYVTAWGDKVGIMGFIAKSLTEQRRIHMQAHVLLLTKKPFDVIPWKNK